MIRPRPCDDLPAAEAARIDGLAAAELAARPHPTPNPGQLALAEAVMAPALRTRVRHQKAAA